MIDPMTRFMIATGGLFVLMSVLALAAPAMPDGQCSALWNKARGPSIGELKPDEARPYVADFSKADTDSNQMLDSKEWADACKAGAVRDPERAAAGTGPR